MGKVNEDAADTIHYISSNFSILESHLCFLYVHVQIQTLTFVLLISHQPFFFLVKVSWTPSMITITTFSISFFSFTYSLFLHIFGLQFSPNSVFPDDQTMSFIPVIFSCILPIFIQHPFIVDPKFSYFNSQVSIATATDLFLWFS